MITRITQTIFFFMLVWVSYRIMYVFLEGYDDYIQQYDQRSPHRYDLFNPIFLIPEAVALSIATYVWRSNHIKNDMIKSIFHIFGSLFIWQVFNIVLLSARIGFTLNGPRDYNMYNYIGSCIALIVATLPWVYRQWQKRQEAESVSNHH